MPSIRDEIRRLVQAFLDARATMIPRPRRPTRQPLMENDDSQDYWIDEIDPLDPELEVALGGAILPEQQEAQRIDAKVCEVRSHSPFAAMKNADCSLCADH